MVTCAHGEYPVDQEELRSPLQIAVALNLVDEVACERPCGVGVARDGGGQGGVHAADRGVVRHDRQRSGQLARDVELAGERGADAPSLCGRLPWSAVQPSEAVGIADGDETEPTVIHAEASDESMGLQHAASEI